MLYTGICFESSPKINGVKGIVRLKQEDKQNVLFEEFIYYEANPLTFTENSISNLLINGLSRKEIAIHKNISLHTVNTHIKKIYKKLNINRVSELRHLL